MDLQQLRYFLESAESENFSHTAARHFVPASAVSASVKKLESELGVKLFDRTANRITLNSDGQAFAKTVREALALLDGARAHFAERQNEIAGEIRMLIRTERSLVSEKMIAFRKEHPGVSFRLSHSFQKTNAAHYDLIIDEATAEYKGYERRPFLSERVYIAASAKSPLCGRQLSLSMLKDSDFISMSGGSSLYRQLTALCADAGFSPRIMIESDDPRYIRKYIAEGFGLSLFPERSWGHERSADIAFLDVEGFPISRKTYVYAAGSGKTCVRAFCSYLCGEE